jgi:hypothetical protein
VQGHFGADVSRNTDKMPANFLFAGLIHLALPNATIIHTVRDPVDTCISCKLFTEGSFQIPWWRIGTACCRPDACLTSIKRMQLRMLKRWRVALSLIVARRGINAALTSIGPKELSVHRARHRFEGRSMPVQSGGGMPTNRCWRLRSRSCHRKCESGRATQPYG